MEQRTILLIAITLSCFFAFIVAMTVKSIALAQTTTMTASVPLTAENCQTTLQACLNHCK